MVVIYKIWTYFFNYFYSVYIFSVEELYIC